MATKKAAKVSPKKAMQEMVEKSLGTLLLKLDPAMTEKKSKKKIKEASKILVKGIKIKKEKTKLPTEPKEVVSST